MIGRYDGGRISVLVTVFVVVVVVAVVAIVAAAAAAAAAATSGLVVTGHDGSRGLA